MVGDMRGPHKSSLGPWRQKEANENGGKEKCLYFQVQEFCLQLNFNRAQSPPWSTYPQTSVLICKMIFLTRKTSYSYVDFFSYL